MTRAHENQWGLTAEEFRTMQVLVGPAKGVTKVATRLLNVEIRGVDKRVSRIMRKMGCTNRVEAILVFDRRYRTMVDPKVPTGVAPCQDCRGLGFVRNVA